MNYPTCLDYKGYNLLFEDFNPIWEVSFVATEMDLPHPSDLNLPLESKTYFFMDTDFPSIWTDNGGDGLVRFSTNNKEEMDKLIQFIEENGGTPGLVLEV